MVIPSFAACDQSGLTNQQDEAGFGGLGVGRLNSGLDLDLAEQAGGTQLRLERLDLGQHQARQSRRR